MSDELKLDIDISSIIGTHMPRIGSTAMVGRDPTTSWRDIKNAGRWVSAKASLVNMRQDSDSLVNVSLLLVEQIVQEKEVEFAKQVDEVIQEVVGGFHK